MVKVMVRYWRYLLGLTAIACLLVPAAANAAPELADSQGGPLTSLADQSFPYVVAGGQWSIPVTVRDRQSCKDKQNNALLGGRVEVLLGDEDNFAVWRSVTLTAEVIEDRCDEGGYLLARPDMVFVAPEVRQQFRLRFVGRDSAATITSDSAYIYPSFQQQFSWFIGRGGRPALRKGYVTVRLNGDPRLVGMQATLMWRKAGASLYNPVASKVISSRRGRAVLRFDQRRGRSGWRAYVCLDYASRYPQMWTGQSCPIAPVTSEQLESLFPWSTRTTL